MVQNTVENTRDRKNKTVMMVTQHTQLTIDPCIGLSSACGTTPQPLGFIPQLLSLVSEL